MKKESPQKQIGIFKLDEIGLTMNESIDIAVAFVLSGLILFFFRRKIVHFCNKLLGHNQDAQREQGHSDEAERSMQKPLLDDDNDIATDPSRETDAYKMNVNYKRREPATLTQSKVINLIEELVFNQTNQGQNNGKKSSRSATDAPIALRTNSILTGQINGNSSISLDEIKSTETLSNKDNEQDSTSFLESADEIPVEEKNAEEDTGETNKAPENDIPDVTEVTSPKGTRWAVCSSDVDLTGKWTVITSAEWKTDYDLYLKALGINGFKRKIASAVIHLNKEELIQSKQGKNLLIRSINPKGTWERTCIASGTEVGKDEYEPFHTKMKSAVGEPVESESWWEQEGKVHHSWNRGAPAGDYEALRYLEPADNGEGEDVYVCESIFYERGKNGKVSTEKSGSITWRFRRE